MRHLSLGPCRDHEIGSVRQRSAVSRGICSKGLAPTISRQQLRCPSGMVSSATCPRCPGDLWWVSGWPHGTCFGGPALPAIAPDMSVFPLRASWLLVGCQESLYEGRPARTPFTRTTIHTLTHRHARTGISPPHREQTCPGRWKHPLCRVNKQTDPRSVHIVKLRQQTSQGGSWARPAEHSLELHVLST